MQDYRILKGQEVIDKLYLEDIETILDYGWDRRDLQEMLDARDWESIGYLAAWIRECGNGHTGFMIEDDLCDFGIGCGGCYR